MKRIIIDMDEVIADPMSEMIDWYSKTYGLPIDFGAMLGGSWVKGFPSQHQELVMKRLLSPGFFRHLPVIKNSIEAVLKLNDSYEIYIASAATEFPNSLKDKLEWLGEHFPFLTWKQLILCGDKRAISGDFMIDDHTRHLKHFKGKPYLFTSPHNLNETGYERINDWNEAENIFLLKDATDSDEGNGAEYK
jgi:5'-nucleotidase